MLNGLLIMLFISFSKTLSRTESDTTYEKYYVMIAEDSGSSFWKSVYSSALLAAKEQNAYVEMISDNLSREYSQSELDHKTLSILNLHDRQQLSA